MRRTGLHIFFVSILMLLGMNGSVKAQTAVTATPDTNEIRIGEQFRVSLRAIAPAGSRVFFPAVPDTFDGFEVVDRGSIDTLASQDNMTLTQQLTLTAFDSGYFVIEPFYFGVQEKGSAKIDSLSTEAQLISVRTIAIDTTKDIRDIKPVMTVPFPWMYYLPWAIGALLLIAVIIYLYKKYNRPKEKPVEIKQEPAIPADTEALEALRRIEEQKLWQQGMVKRYFSEITDVLRNYLSRRYGMHAMEMTTDEILHVLRGSLIGNEPKEKLKFVLELADLVKFAKATPLASQNEQAMQYAHACVIQTRQALPEEAKAEANV